MLLSVRDLRISFKTGKTTTVEAIKGISFDVPMNATVALVGVTLAIALFAGPIYDLSHRAAEGLMDPSGYVQAVLGS